MAAAVVRFVPYALLAARVLLVVAALVAVLYAVGAPVWNGE